jgi:hypothetical protein
VDIKQSCITCVRVERRPPRRNFIYHLAKAKPKANATIPRAEKKAAKAQAAEAKAKRKKDAKRKRTADIEAKWLDRRESSHQNETHQNVMSYSVSASSPALQCGYQNLENCLDLQLFSCVHQSCTSPKNSCANFLLGMLSGGALASRQNSIAFPPTSTH